jgi:hypothetical protein
VLADPRPRRTSKVEQADSPMPQIVRRERRHTGRGGRARDCGAELSPPNPWKTGRVAVRSSRATSPHTASNSAGGTFTPAGAARLGDGLGDAPAAAPLVDVAPRQPDPSCSRVLGRDRARVRRVSHLL